MRNSVRWTSVKDGLPAPSNCEFYGERYSLPVLGANRNTGQTFDAVLVYDFRQGGWCFNGLPDGPNPNNYEVCSITDWGHLPNIKED